jgi:outer membrane protein OmpA-like peptidoglycan-associated protein
MYMSLARKRGISSAFFLSLLLVMELILIASPGFAQEEAAPKLDLFGGYQYLDPRADVPAPGTSFFAPTALRLPSFNGGGAALTFNFTRYWGLEFDGGGNWGNGANDGTLSAGPRLMWRTEGMNFFVHAVGGWNRLDVYGLKPSNGLGAFLGGGIDLPINTWLSLRLAQVDYAPAHHNFSDFASSTFPSLRRPNSSGVRLRTGLVLSFDYPETVTPSAACSVQPSEVMAGEPITATAAASGFNPKHTLSYSWTTNGGKITGKDNTATIDTNGMSGGSYVATAQVSDPKMKKGGATSCTATFSVKEPPKNPPTLSLSASPTSVARGGTISLSASCTSPDGVPVSVSGWTATGGSVSGSGSSAALNTTGAATGPVTVNATCSDSRGLVSSASTQVTVENPPPPPIPPEVKQLEARLSLHSIYFPTAQPTVANPKGGLLASQQQTLVALARDFQRYLTFKPDAHLILEGHADPRGSVKYNQLLSERRVERTKGFLIEQGVPEGDIDTKALGDQHNLTADEVRASVEQNPELTTEERQRVLRNMTTIILASNRRVDVTLSTTGQTSVRQYPFNAADSLSLIGGREAARKAAKPVPRRRPRKRTP